MTAYLHFNNFKEFPTKKAMKEWIGKEVCVIVPQPMGDEYVTDYVGAVVYPGPYERKGFGKVTVVGGILKGVV